MRTKYANKLARIEYNCDWCVLLSLYAFGCSVFNAELCHGRQVVLCLSILSDFIAFLLFIRLSDRYSVLTTYSIKNNSAILFGLQQNQEYFEFDIAASI